MNALLLSAGQGTRLKPLTDDCPKCLLPVFQDDSCMLDYWITTLCEQGIEKIYINVDYLKDKIIQYVNDNYSYFPLDKKNSLNINFIHELIPGSAINQIKEKQELANDALVTIFSDTYIPQDQVKTYLKFAIVSKYYPVCAGIEKTHVKNKSHLLLNDGIVYSFLEKPEYDRIGYSSAGIYMFRGIDLYDKNLDNLMIDEIIKKYFLEETSTVILQKVMDIGGSISDYNKAREQLKEIKI